MPQPNCIIPRAGQPLRCLNLPRRAELARGAGSTSLSELRLQERDADGLALDNPIPVSRRFQFRDRRTVTGNRAFEPLEASPYSHGCAGFDDRFC